MYHLISLLLVDILSGKLILFTIIKCVLTYKGNDTQSKIVIRIGRLRNFHE